VDKDDWESDAQGRRVHFLEARGSIWTTVYKEAAPLILRMAESNAPQIPPATVVTLDRVISCYPLYEPLLEESLRHAERCFAVRIRRMSGTCARLSAGQRSPPDPGESVPGLCSSASRITRAIQGA
jgi:hypothetical protein